MQSFAFDFISPILIIFNRLVRLKPAARRLHFAHIQIKSTFFRLCTVFYRGWRF